MYYQSLRVSAPVQLHAPLGAYSYKLIIRWIVRRQQPILQEHLTMLAVRAQLTCDRCSDRWPYLTSGDQLVHCTRCRDPRALTTRRSRDARLAPCPAYAGHWPTSDQACPLTALKCLLLFASVRACVNLNGYSKNFNTFMNRLDYQLMALCNSNYFTNNSISTHQV